MLFTVNEETIEDAVAAINLLKSDSTVDPNAIYVCGHSFGGMLLPRIAAKATGIKGLIYLCPNGRPLEDMIYEQTAYTLSYDTTVKNHSAILDSLKLEVNKIKTLKSTDSDSTYLLRIPVMYWKDLNKYDPFKSAEKLNTPMLFLQGGRDYQVTDVDYSLWKERLKNKKATFNYYPDLSHFFIKGEGKSLPSEYDKPGNVDFKVIEDISGWISSPKK
jgi:dienelactone hydrolase